MLKYKRTRYLFFFIIVTILSCLAVYLYWPTSQSKVSVTQKPIPVRVALTKEVISPKIISLIGVLTATRSVIITPVTAGIISNIEIKDGQRVKKGDLLVKLQNSSYQLQLEAAKIQSKQLKDLFDKSKGLFLKKVLTETEYSKAVNNYQIQRIEVAKLQKAISNTFIRAPFSGTVGKINIDIGSYVTEGESITTLVNTDHVNAVYHVPGELYPQLKVGQKVSLSSDAYLEHTYHGKVNFVSPIIDKTTNTVALTANVPNTKHQLTAGMYVTIKQNIGQQQKMIAIPNQALIPTISGNRVYIIQDKKSKSLKVTVNAIVGNTAYIRSGLRDKEQVVVEGQEKLKDGAYVKTIESR